MAEVGRDDGGGGSIRIAAMFGSESELALLFAYNGVLVGLTGDVVVLTVVDAAACLAVASTSISVNSMLGHLLISALTVTFMPMVLSTPRISPHGYVV